MHVELATSTQPGSVGESLPPADMKCGSNIEDLTDLTLGILSGLHTHAGFRHRLLNHTDWVGTLSSGVHTFFSHKRGDFFAKSRKIMFALLLANLHLSLLQDLQGVARVSAEIRKQTLLYYLLDGIID